MKNSVPKAERKDMNAPLLPRAIFFLWEGSFYNGIPRLGSSARLVELIERAQRRLKAEESVLFVRSATTDSVNTLRHLRSRVEGKTNISPYLNRKYADAEESTAHLMSIMRGQPSSDVVVLITDGDYTIQHLLQRFMRMLEVPYTHSPCFGIRNGSSILLSFGDGTTIERVDSVPQRAGGTF